MCPDFAAEHADISTGGIGKYNDWTLTIVRTDAGPRADGRGCSPTASIEVRPGDDDPDAIALMHKLSRKSRKRWPEFAVPSPGAVPLPPKPAPASPCAVALVGDLMDRSRVSAVLPDVRVRVGTRRVVVADTVIVDLAAPVRLSPRSASAATGGPHRRVHGPARRRGLLARARADGAHALVLTRSQFFHDPGRCSRHRLSARLRTCRTRRPITRSTSPTQTSCSPPHARCASDSISRTDRYRETSSSSASGSRCRRRRQQPQGWRWMVVGHRSGEACRARRHHARASAARTSKPPQRDADGRPADAPRVPIGAVPSSTCSPTCRCT